MRFVSYAALCGFAACAFGASHGDFSGTWKMDATRSESAHQAVPVGPSTLVIRLSEGALIMETTQHEAGGGPGFHEILNLRLDGAETTSPTDSGAPVTGKAHWDGARLVVETSRNVQDSTVTTTYVHTLSANGREMTIDKTLTVQHGYMGVAAAPSTGHGKDIFVRVAK
jgi:hypothetical protein